MVSLQRKLHQPVCLEANTELTSVLLTAATERKDEEEETAKERERERRLVLFGYKGVCGHRDQKLLKGNVAIEMSIMAELSSAQVTECT